MSLKSIFTEQIESLRDFMQDPSQRLRVVAYMRDVEPLLEKVLAKWDDDAENPHVLVVCSAPCRSYPQYCEQVLQELAEQNERHRQTLAEIDVALPRLEDVPSTLAAGPRLAAYVSAVADALPCQAGKYAVIFYPDQIASDDAYLRSLAEIVEHTATDWARYIALDRKDDPRLAPLVTARENCSLQMFDFSPDEIEKRVADDLKNDRLSPAERRQYTAMQGAYAMGQGDYAVAEAKQKEALAMAQRDGAAPEEAALWYNLGNTYLAQGKLELAEEHYASAIEFGAAEELHGLVAMALTNLGVTLQRRGEPAQALESLDAAQRTFKALNHPPGEAYALDNRAQVLASEQRNEEAEAAWLEALAVYDSISSDTFDQVREKGQEDILQKLHKFYEATEQAGKIKALESRTEQPR